MQLFRFNNPLMRSRGNSHCGLGPKKYLISRDCEHDDPGFYLTGCHNWGFKGKWKLGIYKGKIRVFDKELVSGGLTNIKFQPCKKTVTSQSHIPREETKYTNESLSPPPRAKCLMPKLSKLKFSRPKVGFQVWGFEYQV